MAKKINFSSVQKQANVEVIELNTYFVARVIKANSIIENAIKACTYKSVNDDSGEEKLNFCPLPEDYVQKIYEEVLPFLKELEDGFMSDSKE